MTAYVRRGIFWEPVQDRGSTMAPVVGYVASHEQFTSSDLIEYAVAAERAGFDALWASDHFHPWQP